MKNEEFIKELKELLEIEEELSNKSTLNLSSLNILSIISFVDENFDIRIKAADLKNVNSVEDLIHIIGKDKIQ